MEGSLVQLSDLLRKLRHAPNGISAYKAYIDALIDYVHCIPTIHWCQCGEHLESAVIMLYYCYGEHDVRIKEILGLVSACLQSCRTCVESYYARKPNFADSLKFWSRRLQAPTTDTPRGTTALLYLLERQETNRLVSCFDRFMQTSNVRDPPLIFALFEVLCWPEWIWHNCTRLPFSQAILALLEAKKMLKVSEPLPGVLACLLHPDVCVARWAKQTIEGARLRFSADMTRLAFIGNPLPRLAFSNDPDEQVYIDNVLLLVECSDGLPSLPALSTLIGTFQDRALRVCLQWTDKFGDHAHCMELLSCALTELRSTKLESLRECRRSFFHAMSVKEWSDCEIQLGWMAFLTKRLLSFKSGGHFPVMETMLQHWHDASLAFYLAAFAVNDEIALQLVLEKCSLAGDFQRTLLLLPQDQTIDVVAKGQFGCLKALLSAHLTHQRPLDNGLMSSILKAGVLSLGTTAEFLSDVFRSFPEQCEQLATLPFYRTLALRCLTKLLELNRLSGIDDSRLLEPFIGVCDSELGSRAVQANPRRFLSALRDCKSPKLAAQFVDIVLCQESLLSALDREGVMEAVKPIFSLPSIIIQVCLTDDLTVEQQGSLKVLLVRHQQQAPDECLERHIALLNKARIKLHLAPLPPPSNYQVHKNDAESTCMQVHLGLDQQATQRSKIRQMKADMLVSQRKRPPVHRELLIDPKHPSVKPRVSHAVHSPRPPSDTDDDDDERSMRDTRQSLSEAAQRHAMHAQQVPRTVKLIDLPTSLHHNNYAGAVMMSKRPASVRDPHAAIKLFHKFVVNLKWTDLSREEREVLDCEPGSQASIPRVFATTDDYERTFEPLLRLETTAQLMADRLEDSSSAVLVAKVTGVIAIDNDFYECSLGNVMANPFAQSDQNQGHNRSRGRNPTQGQGGEMDPRAGFSEHDVLKVLRNDDDGSQSIVILGVVSVVTAASVVVRVGKLLAPEALLREGQMWRLTPFSNVVTAVREFLALKYLPTFERPVLSAILGKSQDQPASTLSISDRMTDASDDGALNESQRMAVRQALHDRHAITLIQGPPGTGKTRTIESLIVALKKGVVDRGGDTGGILVCAPSNAAVDELCSRLMKRPDLSIVRIGNPEMVAEHVRPVLLDSLVDAQLASLKQQRAEAERALTSLAANQAINSASHQMTTNGAANQTTTTNNAGHHHQMAKLRDIVRKATKGLEEARTALRVQLLRSADVVGCTLSGSGHEALLRLERPFPTVIVDEACQAVELSTLVPLQHGCRKLVLVGDPQQLPPTVLSAVRSYEVSLFQRLAQHGTEVHLLSMQYRMHPDIARFPSAFFYGGRLLDAPGLDVLTAAPWHRVGSLGPCRLFDIPWGREQARLGRRSLYNDAEARIVVQLVEHLLSSVPINYPWTIASHDSGEDGPKADNGGASSKIAVITPYNEQKRRLRHEFARAGISPHLVHVSTVDGFQGQERPVVIFSCVRTGNNAANGSSDGSGSDGRRSGLGFLTDCRRINVALTRAQSSLWIVGRCEALRRNRLWRALVEDAEQRNLIVHMPPPRP